MVRVTLKLPDLIQLTLASSLHVKSLPVVKLCCILAFVTLPSLTQARDLCDTYGALEFDPLAVAPAVAFEEIDPALLIKACTNSIARSDHNLPRYFLQRSRGYLRIGDNAEALADIKASHEMHYPAATHELGMMHYMGTGVVKDYEMSRALFELAYDEGVRLSANALSILYQNEAYEYHDPKIAETWGMRFSYDVPNGLSASRSLIDPIIDIYQRECDEAIRNDLNTTNLFENSPIVIQPSNFYDIEINSERLLATVVHAGFRCGDLGYFWSGSGGSPLYIIAGGRIFEHWLSHRPFSITRERETFVMIPKHGTACDASDSELSVPGADTCYAVSIWNDDLKTFYGFNNVLTYSQLNSLID